MMCPLLLLVSLLAFCVCVLSPGIISVWSEGAFFGFARGGRLETGVVVSPEEKGGLEVSLLFSSAGGNGRRCLGVVAAPVAADGGGSGDSDDLEVPGSSTSGSVGKEMPLLLLILSLMTIQSFPYRSGACDCIY